MLSVIPLLNNVVLLLNNVVLGVVRPKVLSVLNHMKEGGIDKIGVIGFCW
jgi:hypothetical protein